MKKAIAAILALSLVGCAATPYRPVVDIKGVDMARYQSDMDECQQYAASSDAGQGATNGAVAGAIFGALLGAAIGGSDGAKLGAQVGGLNGAAAGAGDAVLTGQQIVKNCMAGRGYKVLA